MDLAVLSEIQLSSQAGEEVVAVVEAVMVVMAVMEHLGIRGHIQHRLLEEELEAEAVVEAVMVPKVEMLSILGKDLEAEAVAMEEEEGMELILAEEAVVVMVVIIMGVVERVISAYPKLLVLKVDV